MKHKKSITKRLLLITLSLTMSIAILVATYCYFSYRSILRSSLKQSTEYSLQLLDETIQYDMNNALALLDFCASNDMISSYLKASNLHQENAASLANLAWQRLREEYRGNSSFIYFNRILVSDLNDNYIQISPSALSQNLPCAKVIREQPFFTSLYENPGMIRTEILQDPLAAYSNDLVLPFVRPITSVYGGSAIGWCYLAISPNIFINRFLSYNLPSDSELYLTIGDTSYLWGNGRLTKADLDPATDPAPGSSLWVTTKPSKSGWFISQTISQAALAKQTSVYLFTILCIAGIVISLGLGTTLYLHHSINIPIRKLQKKLVLISSGDFSPEPNIEWNNELGEIGRGINSMSANIDRLIQSRMKDQQRKFELEYEVLQNQVNPHFLYNTLNSISWMATAQGSRGISDMASSLSFLLKSISKKSGQEHTIREEFALLDHYFLIQKYRYGGILSMHYHVEPEEVYDCLILKFIFQIIVENAIFHGISPKEAPGIIDITVAFCNKQNDVSISITDNGVGMSQELIHEILTTDTASSDLFHKIGIRNIQKRMQYAYGPDYGISIQSVVGQFTNVMITIPYHTKEEKDHV